MAISTEIDDSGPTRQTFLCPACGGTEPGTSVEINRAFEADSDDPWDGVLSAIECGRCGALVPAHVAERWDGMTVKEAREEWRRFQDHSPE